MGLNAERESKQSMQRSKSCSETEFLSNLRNQSKEIKELKDKNEKMNETLNGNMTRYEQMSGKVNKLENDLQAANARHGALYKLYCDEVEKNKKWAEIDSDYKKLQNEKNELIENEKQNRNLCEAAVQKSKEIRANAKVICAQLEFEKQCREEAKGEMDLRQQKINALEDRIIGILQKLKEEKATKQRIQRSKSMSEIKMEQDIAILNCEYDKVLSQLNEQTAANNAMRKEMREQIATYKEQIRQIEAEKEREAKAQAINKLKYAVIGTQSSLSLIKGEYVAVTKDVNKRLSAPLQMSQQFDGDLIDVLLVRQTKLVREYKQKYDELQKSNQQLTQMTA